MISLFGATIYHEIMMETTNSGIWYQTFVTFFSIYDFSDVVLCNIPVLRVFNLLLFVDRHQKDYQYQDAIPDLAAIKHILLTIFCLKVILILTEIVLNSPWYQNKYSLLLTPSYLPVLHCCSVTLCYQLNLHNTCVFLPSSKTYVHSRIIMLSFLIKCLNQWYKTNFKIGTQNCRDWINFKL